MNGPSRQEALWLRTVGQAAHLSEARAEADRAAPPGSPGDVFLLGEGDGAQEWVVLRLDGAAGRALAVPADVHPMAGGTDVRLVRDARSGPMTLRCRLASWIDTRRLEPARRSGRVDEATVARALERCAQLEAGALSSGALTDVDLDPEYRDLMEETSARVRALPADARRSAPPPAPSAVRAAPPRGAFGRWRPALLPAFSALLVAGAVWQAGQNAALRDDLRRLEGESGRRAAERPPSAASPAPRLVPQPLVNVPLAWLAPLEATRGGMAEQTVAPAADHFLLVLEIPDRAPGGAYVLEVRPRGAGAPVLTLAGVRRGPSGAATVALPRAALPEGRYRLVLRRAGSSSRDVVHEYAVRTLATPAAISSPR